MTNYKKMYFSLARKIDTVDALEDMIADLKDEQLKCEKEYMESGGPLLEFPKGEN